MNPLMERDKARIIVTLAFALCFLTACGPTQPAQQTGAATAAAKRHPLTGRVVSIDKPNRSINIDGDEIPGFMAAMQMPYSVKDASLLEKIEAGDQIKAEIVLGDEGAYLESLAVVTKAKTPNK